MRKSLTLGSLILLLAGCGDDPIIPSKTIQVTASLSYTYAQVLAAVVVIGVAYYVIDPLAPNWEIKATKLDDTRYRIDMRKKRVTTGGDGESIYLFHQQADQLAAQAHSPGYTILAYTEGVESVFPIARRWSQGVVELRPAPAKVGER
jgi:hypothetical protein